MRSKVELVWYRVSKRGTMGSKEFKHPLDDGVYVASVTLPYTDGQCTLDYLALGTVVMLPKMCYNGHDRARFMEWARSEAKKF